MKVALLDTTGKTKGETTLKASVIGVGLNDGAVSHYLRIYNANQRQGNASTKTRGDVSGSSAKPWTQKHTGRARAGEKRNPIWRHGGVAHGPKPKDWSLRSSDALKTAALSSVLFTKANAGAIYVVNAFDFTKTSTKAASSFLNTAGIVGKTLIVLPSADDVLYKSFKNIRGIKVLVADDAAAYDYLSVKNIVFVKDALEKLEKKFKGVK